jgi:hypothetical protein
MNAQCLTPVLRTCAETERRCMAELLLPSLFVAWGKAAGVGAKALMFYLSRSVAGGSNHCSESGRWPNDTCCSLVDAYKQTKPRAGEKKRKARAQRKGRRDRDRTGAEKTRREACLTGQEGLQRSRPGRGRALCLSRLHPHTRMSACSLSRLCSRTETTASASVAATLFAAAYVRGVLIITASTLPKLWDADGTDYAKEEVVNKKKKLSANLSCIGAA